MMIALIIATPQTIKLYRALADLLLNEIQIFENFVTVYNIYCDYTNVYMFSFDNPLKGQIKSS